MKSELKLLALPAFLLASAHGVEANDIRPNVIYVERGYSINENSNGQLFNLKTDFREFRDVYNENPDIVAKLQKMLDDCRAADF